MYNPIVSRSRDPLSSPKVALNPKPKNPKTLNPKRGRGLRGSFVIELWGVQVPGDLSKASLNKGPSSSHVCLLKFRGFEFRGLGFRRLRAWGSGFRVSGLGIGIQVFKFSLRCSRRSIQHPSEIGREHICLSRRLHIEQTVQPSIE